MTKPDLAAFCAALVLMLGGVAQAQPAVSWTGSWASAQQVPEPNNALPPTDLQDATLRQIVHLSLGGSAVRIRLANDFGTQPLTFTSVHVALARAPGTAAIVAGSDRTVTFSGQGAVTVPAGAAYWSDPVQLSAIDGADLAVSFHFGRAPQGETSHPGSRATSFLVHGDHTADPDLPGAERFEHWFELSGVDVRRVGAAVVAFGDSITDGHGSTTDRNDRWPDDLARRLHAAGRAIGVLNAGIGGNHILTDGLGPNAIARFERDVLDQTGVRAVILLEGINDLGGFSRDHADAPPEGHAALLARLFQADEQFIARAREHGLKVFGATLTPYVGSDYYHPGPANEADRQKLNAWIRTPGRFDAVIDFDKAARDPAHPDRLLPAYDSGDHLHPSPAGYRAMAQAIPLAILPSGRGR